MRHLGFLSLLEVQYIATSAFFWLEDDLVCFLSPAPFMSFLSFLLLLLLSLFEFVLPWILTELDWVCF